MWRADMVVGAPSHSISERLSATPDPAPPPLGTLVVSEVDPETLRRSMQGPVPCPQGKPVDQRRRQ